MAYMEVPASLAVLSPQEPQTPTNVVPGFDALISNTPNVLSQPSRISCTAAPTTAWALPGLNKRPWVLPSLPAHRTTALSSAVQNTSSPSWNEQSDKTSSSP